MTFWEFFNSHFWWCILLLALSLNDNTWIIGIILAFILVITGGSCSLYILIPLGVIACIVYIFSFGKFWKAYYQNEIKRLKHKVWKLQKEKKHNK